MNPSRTLIRRGATGFATPNLDRLAGEGTRFTHFYVAQPVCSASRAALLTGCYPNRLGIAGALGPGAKHGIADEETTLAEVCRAAGYATAAFGKWHLGHRPRFLPTRHGFDEFYGYINMYHAHNFYPEFLVHNGRKVKLRNVLYDDWRAKRIGPQYEGAGVAKVAEALKAPVAQLLDEPAVLFKEKINFKMPGGGGFAPHQDSQAGWDTYADFFISALVSIDRATLENGCLQLAAGHHKSGLVKSWEPLNEDDMKGMCFEPVPTAPGDIVFFDCYAPHASEANMSDTIRRIYYATYNRASAGDHMAQYYADKHKNFPPDIDRDPDKEYVFRV